MAALAVAAGVATSATAMSPQEEATFRQYCTNDYMRFCSMFDPNTPQVEQCFQQRLKELSPRCQSAIASFSKKNPEGRRR
ncbi:hypothetical protein [Enterovirga aerilata]|uniref:Uncharacterized protein n=1 Tax=Enterovirga aerilata TaxID=2730920 RepID=A0A849I474_9HYPH|nr:hypothetical protein [Enterovirga sp. DB1703]NNM72474.1 hypothetical protein [Enterovirga sp. DB1703]